MKVKKIKLDDYTLKINRSKEVFQIDIEVDWYNRRLNDLTATNILAESFAESFAENIYSFLMNKLNSVLAVTICEDNLADVCCKVAQLIERYKYFLAGTDPKTNGIIISYAGDLNQIVDHIVNTRMTQSFFILSPLGKIDLSEHILSKYRDIIEEKEKEIADIKTKMEQISG